MNSQAGVRVGNIHDTFFLLLWDNFSQFFVFYKIPLNELPLILSVLLLLLSLTTIQLMK